MDKWEEFMQQAEALGEGLDIDLDWEEIQAKRKKRRFLGWFNQNSLAVLGLIVILLLIGFLALPTRNDDQPTTEAVASTSVTNQDRAATSANTPATKKISAVIESTNSIKKQGQVVDNKKVTLNKVVASIATTPSVNTEKNKPSTNIKTNHTLKAVVTDKTIEAIPTKDAIISSSEKAINITKNNHKFTYSIPTELPTEKLSKEQEIQLPIAIKSSYSPPRLALISPISLDVINHKVKIRNTPRKIIQSQSSKWSMGIRATYSMPFRKIEGSEETSSARRNNAETFLEAADVQVQIQKKITDKLYVASGITISQYRSNFIDEYQIHTNVAFENRVTEIVTKNGVDVESIGTVYGSRLELYNNIKYQRYIDVSIPIQLGIQLPLNRTWSMKAASGLNYSLFHLNKGNVIASATSIGTYSSLNALNYRTKGLLQAASNIELVKSLRGNLDITLGLQMKHDLNSRLTDNVIEDKFHMFGANIGLMKRF